MIEDRTPLKLYLLGILSEEEQLALEQRLCLDNDEFDQLLVAEDELTDDYARGALSPSDRERFERHFLSTADRYQKLNFAQAFHRHLDRVYGRAEGKAPATSPKRDWLLRLSRFLNSAYPVRGYVLTAACASVAFGSILVTVKFIRVRDEMLEVRTQLGAPRSTEQDLRRQLAELRASNEQLEQELRVGKAQMDQLERSLATARPEVQRSDSSPAAALAAFMLTPGAMTRAPSGDAVNQVRIPAGARTVRLRLELEKDQFPSYRAALQTQGGRGIKRWENLTPRKIDDGQSLSIEFPAALLPAGLYLIGLEGVTPEGLTDKADRFHFQVVRE